MKEQPCSQCGKYGKREGYTPCPECKKYQCFNCKLSTINNLALHDTRNKGHTLNYPKGICKECIDLYEYKYLYRMTVEDLPLHINTVWLNVTIPDIYNLLLKHNMTVQQAILRYSKNVSTQERILSVKPIIKTPS